jgi:hypothetical protein
LGDDAPIDFHFPGDLRGREVPLPHGLLQEGIFLFAIEIAHPVGVLDQVTVGIRGEILRNPLQAVEEVPSVNSNEAVDANVSDVGRVTIEVVAYVAVLLDVLAAGTLIKFFTNFDSDKRPFSAGDIEAT